MHLHENANPICDSQFVRKAVLQIGKPDLTDAAGTPPGERASGVLYWLLLDLSI
jgi:hypothetical protein